MAAYFRFDQSLDKGGPIGFIFRLDDAAKIAEARAIIAGTQVDRVHVQGTIVQTGAPYNPNWSFHLDPATIGFFELQIEVCDADMGYVESHLDEVGGAFLPRSFWCPWNSTLVAEVTGEIDPVSEKPVDKA